MSCSPAKTCAHEASKYLSNEKNYSELNAGSGTNERIVGGMLRCSCGLVLRAKELKNWASSKGTKEQSVSNEGLYVIYEENTSNGQGHVYVKDNGENKGNGLYNWSAADLTAYYKLE